MSARVWSFILTGPAFSSNGRYHWAVRNRLTQEWRESAGWMARQKQIPHLERARIEVDLLTTNKHRHDADNIQPASKAIADGIVDAGVLDDDDSSHLDGPMLRVIPGSGQKPGRGRWALNVIVTEVPA